MKNVLFFLSLLFFSFQAFSQNYTLQGLVTRGEAPLEGVSVFAIGTGKGTQTDEDGSYSLTLQEGHYTILYSFGNRKRIQVNLNQDKILNVDMKSAEEVLDEVFLSSLRVNAQSPITYSNLSNEEIQDRNLGQDIPALMNFMPNVVTTSDAGAGIGYSGLRVRGSDATRVNVTINGIPVNDAESQGVFWVNMGDFASSVENLQLQRGVGTSTNGAGAFGASLNILTERYQEEASAELANSVGSYNTFKHTLEFSTGLMDEHWAFAGRASKIRSDGYVDRAEIELKSYFLQGTYVDDNTLFKAIAFGGSESTYHAWNGIDSTALRKNRTYNPAGSYEDEEGIERFYENQTDNYKQDNYQLLWNEEFSDNWSSNLALHYTYGRGYYEEFEEDATLTEFGMQPFSAEGEEVTTSDLVGRKWLDNDFFGTTFSLNYQKEDFDVVLGGGWNKYIGDHFGNVIYSRFAQNRDPYEPYYENTGTKTDFNIYAKANFAITENLAAYADMQLRVITYETEGILDDGQSFDVDDSFTFLNPKAGLTYELNLANQFYFSYGRANREPRRSDYENGDPEHEELNDYEFGWRYNSPNVQVNSNLYFMDYQNQLVLTGGIDDVGAFVRENSGNSYRLGLEVDATIRVSDKLNVRPNIAISRNKNVEFVSTLDGELVEFGDTDISFSPEIVAGNILGYTPVEGLELKLLSKFVGEQYMSNTEAEDSKLDSYFINDFNVQYTWRSAPLFEEIVVTGLVNNLFNKEYVSNGYYDAAWGAGYYPQATTNFLAGLTLRF